MTNDTGGRFDCLEANDGGSGQALRVLFILTASPACAGVATYLLAMGQRPVLVGLLAFLGVQIGLLGVMMR
jgi:hypothetical protein